MWEIYAFRQDSRCLYFGLPRGNPPHWGQSETLFWNSRTLASLLWYCRNVKKPNTLLAPDEQVPCGDDCHLKVTPKVLTMHSALKLFSLYAATRLHHSMLPYSQHGMQDSSLISANPWTYVHGKRWGCCKNTLKQDILVRRHCDRDQESLWRQETTSMIYGPSWGKNLMCSRLSQFQGGEITISPV